MPMIRNGLRTRPKGMKPTPASAASPAIDAELVQTLATLLASSDLAELEIEKGDLRIKLVRHTAVSYAPQPQMVQPASLTVAPVAAPSPALLAELPVADHPGTVKSPMVGTVYRRSSPESKAFVEVGSTVKAGEKILLVEAMKTFNEIVAPRAGVVSAVLVDDGQPVEYGQPLIVIE